MGIYGVLLFFSAVAMYINRRPAEPPKQQIDAVTAGIGMGFVDRVTTDRMLTALERIAVAVEKTYDLRQAHMDEKMDQLLERLEESERRQRRSHDVEASRQSRRRT
jgi:ABC-type Na+ transport system ATPase subunit NatA